MRPGLSDVRATPHCLVSELSRDDFPTFDLPSNGNNNTKCVNGLKRTKRISSTPDYISLAQKTC